MEEGKGMLIIAVRVFNRKRKDSFMITRGIGVAGAAIGLALLVT